MHRKSLYKIEHIPQNELRSSESIGIYIFQLGSKIIPSYIKYVTAGYNPQGYLQSVTISSLEPWHSIQSWDCYIT